ncbi:MAG TPA: LeuA family protein [Myxococcota bacterium]|nr:LeuA family protein [Myxococcota bacterium]
MVAEHNYIYDWNELKGHRDLTQKPFELFDETLRDGIQSPSVTDPKIEKKLEIIHLMADLGITAADIGLPGAGARAHADTLAVAREIARHRLPIKAGMAARTTIKDIQPVVEIAQKTGLQVELYTFIGSSPIRLFTEGWTVDTLFQHIDSAVSFAVREGLSVCLVTEDTTRSRPDVLDPLFRHAIALGIERLCLCDTVGHATPNGIAALFEWTRALLRGTGAQVKLDWHGHNDRGIAVANSITALTCGADRIHGTGLGIGERVGNAAMDQILMNLKLLGVYQPDLGKLLRYCETIAEACHVNIPYNYPLAGRDAFRTGTGVHAAAIIKAKKRHDEYLADRVYSGVPAGLFGRQQEIEIGHMSGLSNVIYWLESRSIDHNEQMVQAIYARAKAVHRILAEEEVLALVVEHQTGPSTQAMNA